MLHWMLYGELEQSLHNPIVLLHSHNCNFHFFFFFLLQRKYRQFEEKYLLSLLDPKVTGQTMKGGRL